MPNNTLSWRCTSWRWPKAWLGAGRPVSEPGGARLVYVGKTGASGATEREQDPLTPAARDEWRNLVRRGGRRDRRAAVRRPAQRRVHALPDTAVLSGPRRRVSAVNPRYSPHELACALGLFPPTDEQAAVIAAPPGPLVVIAGAGAGKTETMAARVVWLVANGYAEPGQVLGLTFTRKAAGQLLRRVRSRLARLAGIGSGSRGAARRPSNRWAPRRSAPTTLSPARCCATMGCCCRSSPTPGCSARPSCGSWPSTWSTGTAGSCAPTRPRPRSRRWCCGCGVSWPSTWWTPASSRDTHVELERLVHALPAGPYQRDRGPSQWLLRLLATQTERAELVPLLDALHERMRAGEGHGLRRADGLARHGWRRTSRRSVEDLRNRYRVVLLDEYQDTGHAQRVALSALFGGGCRRRAWR